jgi:hypothetical protein
LREGTEEQTLEEVGRGERLARLEENEHLGRGMRVIVLLPRDNARTLTLPRSLGLFTMGVLIFREEQSVMARTQFERTEAHPVQTQRAYALSAQQAREVFAFAFLIV